jgi:hypothetical protein
MRENAGHAATVSTLSPALLEARWAFFLMLALATAIGAWLRLHALDQPSFWVDEFFTISRAGRDPLSWQRWIGYLPTQASLWLHGARLSEIGLDNIESWQALGVTERAARLGACWVGIATIPLLGLAARAVVGGGVAGLSVLLLSISPWHVYWSQMARFYSLQFLFTSLFLVALARGLQGGGRVFFGLAGLTALLAYFSHPTALFVPAVSFGALGLVAWLRPPVQELRTALATLVGVGLLCAGLWAGGELTAASDAGPPGLVRFAGQEWDPSLRVLLVGAVLRIEPVVFVVGLGAALGAFWRRDAIGVLFACVALGVPALVLLLKPIFPIGPRYFFPALYAWTLLAAHWAVDVERRLRPTGGTLAGLAGAGALLAAVGANAYLYAADGSGQRDRWQEAIAFVRERAEPGDAVIVAKGPFQARYYMQMRDVSHSEPKPEAYPTLAPGTWLIHRQTRPLGRSQREFFDLEAHFEIPSKPWSRVLYVLRVPDRRRADSAPARRASGS